MRAVVTVALGVLAAGAAHADPCKAILDRGPLPSFLSPGKIFSGPVVYVGDGDSLCVDVGKGGNSANWVEVRLADFYAPELHEAGGPQAKSQLERLVMGHRVGCVADHRSHDRIVAVCRLHGVSLGQRMRAAGVQEGGRGSYVIP